MRVFAATRAAEIALLPWTAAEKDALLTMQFEAQHRSYQDRFTEARFDVIELRGEPAGRLYVDRREDEIRLVDIALLPEHRGRGIGTALLRSLLDEGAASGRRVSIHVEHTNPALRLYERLGFERVRDDGIYWFMEWTPRGVALGMDSGRRSI